VNDTSLVGVTHEDAVAALKATQEHVRLLIGKPSPVAVVVAATHSRRPAERTVPRSCKYGFFYMFYGIAE